MYRWLRIAGNAWITIAVILVFVGYVGIIVFVGWSRFIEIANPFNVINMISIIVVIAPGVGLLMLADRLARRR
jgi:hypothetical protein